MSEWSDTSILKTIENPRKRKYYVKITPTEFTFIGRKRKVKRNGKIVERIQPDYSSMIQIKYCPRDTIVELESLKYYLEQFRDKHISYEYLLNILFDDFMEVLKPYELMVYIKLNPRGGIYAELDIDSKDLELKE